MQIQYSTLKSKKVYNVADGNCLGKVTDILFHFPEGKVTALVVGEKKFLSGGEKFEIGLCCITKIGEDAILVDLKPTRADDICEEVLK